MATSRSIVSAIPRQCYPTTHARRWSTALLTCESRIDAWGHVEAASIVDGPELLRDAAMADARQWTFRPFLDVRHVPMRVSGLVEVSFALNAGDAMHRRAMRDRDTAAQAMFFPPMDRCYAAVRAGIMDAATLASQFNPQERFLKRGGAYAYAARWFLQNRDGEQALPYAQLAVDEVQKGHTDNSGRNAAYGVRGEAEALLGRLQQADDDLRTAEDLERNSIARAASKGDLPTLVREYTSVLDCNLRVRAAVLQRLGRTGEARQQSGELRKLTEDEKRTGGESAR